MTDVFPRRTAAVVAGAAALALFSPVVAHAQLRVATWNISNYGDTSPTAGRSAALQTAIYGSFQNRSMAPDVFLGQEFQSQAAVTNFVSVLNAAPNSPGDWAAAPFYAATHASATPADSAFFYRTSKISYVDTARVAQGDGTTADQPRDTLRFDVALKGYAGSAPALSLYSVHMKSGSAGDDQARRLLEAQRIRDNAQSLPAGRQFLVGGDFNVQSSTQTAYVELVGMQPNDTGRFKDPINTPGSWNGSSTYNFVHTQDPSGAGGMDDRHDQILLGSGLVDGKGFDYIGNPSAAYSTTTWNDPAHSYRAWGNDGTSFNASLTTIGNTMVGPVIAQALIDASTVNGGHLPIFLDLRTPAELAASTTTIDFGTVQQGSDATAPFNVFNDVNASIWTSAGVAELLYSMQASGAFSVPDGFFTDLAGGGANGHLVTLDTSTMGFKTGTLSLFDDGVLARTIALQANVVPEPTCMVLIGIGMLALAGRRRRRM